MLGDRVGQQRIIRILARMVGVYTPAMLVRFVQRDRSARGAKLTLAMCGGRVRAPLRPALVRRMAVSGVVLRGVWVRMVVRMSVRRIMRMILQVRMQLRMPPRRAPRPRLACILVPPPRRVEVRIVRLGVSRFVMMVRMVCGCQVPAEDATPGDRRPGQDERIEEEDRKPGGPPPMRARSAASDAAMPGCLHRASCGCEVSFMIRWGMMERNLSPPPLHRHSHFSPGWRPS